MLRFLCLLTFLCIFPLAAQPVIFTGDVAADFPANATFIQDPGGLDVGVPLALGAGTTSGWDMSGCALLLDPFTGTLYVGFDTFGVAGDADGDGNPDATSPQLAGIGGTDFATWQSTESAAVAFDLDDDGNFDVIYGIPATGDATQPRGAFFAGTIFAAGFAFGAPTPTQPVLATIPNAAAPDLQFTIPGFDVLLNSFLTPNQTAIRVTFFMGSFGDAGIGEDYVPDPMPASIPLSIICRGFQASVQSLPNTCGGTPGEPILTIDTGAIGVTATLTVTSGQPNTHIYVVASDGPVNPWLDPLNGCTVYTDILNMQNFNIFIDSNTDANGSFVWTYNIPNDPTLGGKQLIFQARTWWPGGPIPGGDWPSNGAAVTLGCP